MQQSASGYGPPHIQAQTFIPRAPQLASWADRARALLGLEFARLDWRWALARAIAPAPGETIVDLDLGAGAAMPALLAQTAPGVTAFAICADPQACARAEQRAQAAGAAVRVRHGAPGDAPSLIDAAPDRVVIALFGRAQPTPVQALLAAARDALAPEGRLDVAELQPLAAAEAPLSAALRAAGFERLEERALIPSPSGMVRLLAARTPAC